MGYLHTREIMNQRILLMVIDLHNRYFEERINSPYQ